MLRVIVTRFQRPVKPAFAIVLILLSICLATVPLTAQVLSPTTNSTGIDPRNTYGSDGLIWGWADLHAHMFSNLGFGGLLFWGAPINFNASLNIPLPTNLVSLVLEWCGTALDPRAHGLGGVGDLIGNALRTGNPFSGHWVGGYPEFDGWPRWEDVNHQKMYYKWVQRAFLGGQKLMVMQAVNNEVLCQASNQRAGFGCDDMDAVDRQISATKLTEMEIDLEDNGIVDGSGWFRIAYSPAQARSIIAAGKMAVVLGIEVDSLFGCKQGGPCTPALARTRLNQYYNDGVRHVYPIHVFDNAFGGAAVYNPAFNQGNRVVSGQYMSLRDCEDEGYKYDANGTSFLMQVFAFFQFGIEGPPHYSGDAHCNQRGLTSLGESVIQDMMAKGMIIDVDHMSARMLEEVLEIAEHPAVRYPLVSGHNGFTALSRLENDAEGQRTPDQVRRLRDLGGMVAPNLYQGSTDEIAQHGHVPHDCGYSAKTWAQAYLYAVDRMSGGQGLTAVGMGTDFNGFVKSPAPRVGKQSLDLKACGDDRLAPQITPIFNGLQIVGYDGLVQYPFNRHGKPGQFHEQRTGHQTYNINEYGVAHAGLLPDFIEELKVIGLTDEDLKPLFHSAEKYIQLWELADQRARATTPVTSAVAIPSANTFGWHRANPTVRLTATPHPFGQALTGIAYAVTGAASSIGSHLWPNAVLNLEIEDEGVSTIAYHALQEPNLVEADRQFTIRLDRTRPSVTAVPSAPANASGWHTSPVTVHLAGSDAASGIQHVTYRINGGIPLSLPSPANIPLSSDGIYTVEYSAQDFADNVAFTASLTVRLDKTRPSVTLANNGPVSEGSPVTVVATASDPGSSPAPPEYEFDCDDNGTYEVAPSGSNSVVCTFDDNRTSRVRVRVRDIAGNSTIESTDVIVTNTAPQGVFSTDTVVDEGSSFQLAIDQVTDPSSADTLAGFLFAWNCGSGFGAFGTSESRACQTSNDGALSVAGRLRDKDAGVREYAGSVTVRNVAPVVVADTAAVTVNEGQLAGRTGTYADPGSADNVTLTASIGTVTKTGTNAGSWQWSYAATDGPASHTVTITASDGADSRVVSFPLTVNNVAPGVSPNNGVVSIFEGEIAGNTGIFGDPGNDTVTITASVGSISKSGSNSGSWSWTFGTVDGPLQSQRVTISADDGEGGLTLATFDLVVSNVAPLVNAGTGANVVTRDSFTLTGTWTDPGASIDAPYTWSWTPVTPAVNSLGQALAAANGTAGYGAPISYTAAIAVGGSYVFRFTVTDKDGAARSSEVTVVVDQSSRFVAFATNSVEIKSGAQVTGDIGAPGPASGKTLTEKGVEVAVGVQAQLSPGSAVYADSLIVRSRSSVPLAYFNQLIDRGPGNVVTEVNLPPGVVKPAMQPPSGDVGTQDIWLEGNRGDCNNPRTTCLTSGSTLAPGSYADLRSRAGSNNSPNVLYLTAGDYYFEAINLGQRTELRFTGGPARVFVATQMDTDANSYIGPANGSIAARDVVFYVGGINGKKGNIGSNPKSVSLGVRNTISANFYAPNGTIWLRSDTKATGAFVARDIEVGVQVTLTLDSAFR